MANEQKATNRDIICENLCWLFHCGSQYVVEKRLLGGDDSHEIVHCISMNAEGMCTGRGYGMKGDFGIYHNT